jgi:hypothetical protein
MEIELPYDITLIDDEHYTRLNSRLRNWLVDPSLEYDEAGEMATHAVESLVLALFTAGVPMATPQAHEAIETAVRAIEDYLARL